MAPSSARFSGHAMRRIAVACGCIIVAFILYRNQATLIVVGISLFLAYLLHPIVDYLERCGIRRGLAILLMTLTLLFTVFLLGRFIGQQLQNQIAQAIDLAPRLWQRLYTYLIALAEALEIPVNKENLDQYIARLRDWTKVNFLSILQYVLGFFQHFFVNLTAFIVNILHIILVPVLTFYLLRDFAELKRRFYDVFPPSWRQPLKSWLYELDHVLGGFLRGQLLIAFILAGLYAGALSLVGVPAGLLLGLITGFANMVPYMGIIIGLLPSLLMCALSETPSLWLFVGVLLIYCGGQALEGFYLSPRIMGRETGLHPVVVMVAIMIGGTLFGFKGLLFAVPVAAMIKVAFLQWYRAWRATWSVVE